MNDISNMLRILFQIFGCMLIVVSIYSIIKVYPYSDFRNYTYITKQEREKRSLKAGIRSIGLTFGILFLIFPFVIDDVTIMGLLGIGLCVFSPIIFLLVLFRTYWELRTYTKMEGDIVSTDEDKNTKN